MGPRRRIIEGAQADKGPQTPNCEGGCRCQRSQKGEITMPKYLVTNVYKSTATVEVEAASEADALRIALGAPDEPCNDQWLYESTAREIEDER